MTTSTRKKSNKRRTSKKVTSELPGNPVAPIVTQIAGLSGTRTGAVRGPDGSQVSTPGRTAVGPRRVSRRQITNT